MSGLVNYAVQYAKALAQAYPYTLYFGALWMSPNKDKYKVLDANTIKIPHLVVKGRVDGDRDTITGFTRNHENEWLTYTLRNHREWSTLVHPMDVQQTGGVMAIQNATKVFNEEQKFPEMDAYTISALFAEYATRLSKTPDTTALTAENILQVIDSLMLPMDESRVPKKGRILYGTPTTMALIKNAKDILKYRSLTDGNKTITRLIERIDELVLSEVPSDLMQTVYDFTQGWKKGSTAKQCNFFIVHPEACLPAINYTFAALGDPSAETKGKCVYFEESFEDMYLIDYKANAIAFNIAA
ncbi:MAG: hypothetical protein ACK5L6_10165 [Anaerorhabdus sp.]|uniref:hypothetical protein n=1 Tax=Anaerorhabdus sp. TaxID=1872524 RepID=UPI003A86D39D